MAAPYMPFYVADYLADTTHLNRSEHGAYLLLLMGMWRGGGKLPNDDIRLAKIAMCTPAEWAEIRTTMLEFFKVRGRVLTHKKITEVSAKYHDTIVKRKKAGKESGRKRANKINGKTSTHVEQTFNNQNQNQNQNHIGRLLDESNNHTLSADFDFSEKSVRKYLTKRFGREWVFSYFDQSDWNDGLIYPSTTTAVRKLMEVEEICHLVRGRL